MVSPFQEFAILLSLLSKQTLLVLNTKQIIEIFLISQSCFVQHAFCSFCLHVKCMQKLDMPKQSSKQYKLTNLTCLFSLCLQAASSLEASSSGLILIRWSGVTSPFSTFLNNIQKKEEKLHYCHQDRNSLQPEIKQRSNKPHTLYSYMGTVVL